MILLHIAINLNELFSDEHRMKEGRLKELLGHSPFEVIVGALLGAVVAIYLRSLIVGI